MFVQTLLHSTLSVMCTALIAVSASCFFYSLAFLDQQLIITHTCTFSCGLCTRLRVPLLSLDALKSRNALICIIFWFLL